MRVPSSYYSIQYSDELTISDPTETVQIVSWLDTRKSIVRSAVIVDGDCAYQTEVRVNLREHSGPDVLMEGVSTAAERLDEELEAGHITHEHYDQLADVFDALGEEIDRAAVNDRGLERTL